MNKISFKLLYAINIVIFSVSVFYENSTQWLGVSLIFLVVLSFASVNYRNTLQKIFLNISPYIYIMVIIMSDEQVTSKWFPILCFVLLFLFFDIKTKKKTQGIVVNKIINIIFTVGFLVEFWAITKGGQLLPLPVLVILFSLSKVYIRDFENM